MVPPSCTHVQTRLFKLRRVLHDIWKLITSNEHRIQQQVAAREDLKRGKPRYEAGNEVLVYWPPFRAYTDIARKHRLRYIGPFEVVRMIGENAVELNGLPERMPKVINTEYIHLYKRDDDTRLTSLRQAPQPPRP